MIVWNYRVSYENNLQGIDEIEQILRTFHNIFGLLLLFIYIHLTWRTLSR